MDKSNKLDQLIDNAEELLTKLADAHNPEVQILRDRVDRAVRDARHAIERQGDESSVQIRDMVNALDGYVRNYPWLAVASGALIAGTVAFIAGTLQGRRE